MGKTAEQFAWEYGSDATPELWEMSLRIARAVLATNRADEPQPCPACRAAVMMANHLYAYWDSLVKHGAASLQAFPAVKFLAVRAQHTPGCPNASGGEGEGT